MQDLSKLFHNSITESYVNQIELMPQIVPMKMPSTANMSDINNVVKTMVGSQISEMAVSQQSMVSAMGALPKEFASISKQMASIRSLSSFISKFTETACYPFAEQIAQYNKMGSLLTDLSSNWIIANVFSEYETDDKEKEEIQNTNLEILSQIYDTNTTKNISDESPVIVLSPINDKVLQYLAENPEAWYQLQDDDFELAMVEIYSKLGYDVERTQSTRDGGKDIIIRTPEILGDFIYYVECKKYASKRHIGVNIVRSLIGTVNTDRVNGGILATTSFFTRDARKYVLDNKLDYQIKMHDYNTIQQLLQRVV